LDKANIKFEISAKVLERWDRTIKAASDEDKEHAINIYSTVGEYGYGDGMTAKIVSSILRKAEGAPVVVNINSGGGDFFEGLAIHSLLTNYEGEVRVRVLGLAASAASVIAMAGDSVEIAKAGFVMIHNAWTMAVGNKEEMSKVADMLGEFDKSMTRLYAEKTSIDEREIKKMMAAETWLNGEDALELNFVSALLPADMVEKDETENNKVASALRQLDVALAKSGMPRSERRDLIKQATSGTPCATETVTPSADSELELALNGLLKNINLQVNTNV